MPRQRRLVVPPAPLRALRSHRLLRLVAEPARKRSYQSERPHSHKKFRARRGLVLRLRNRRRHGRSSVSAARAPSAQAADAGSRRQGAAGLAAPPPLSGDVGVPRRGTATSDGIWCSSEASAWSRSRRRDVARLARRRVLTAIVSEAALRSLGST